MRAITEAVFAAAGLPKEQWALCELARQSSEHSDETAALNAFYDGFAPQWALATCRSGVECLHEGQKPPEDLGPVLHLEGVHGGESRILRHLGRSRWRCVRLIETKGDSKIGETIDWLGAGAAGDGGVSVLRYRRYWRICEVGALYAVAARLIGVTP